MAFYEIYYNIKGLGLGAQAVQLLISSLALIVGDIQSLGIPFKLDKAHNLNFKN